MNADAPDVPGDKVAKRKDPEKRRKRREKRERNRKGRTKLPPTLCVIGGLPRGGTRNFADLASAHPDVRLFGEVHRNGVAAATRALKAVEKFQKASDARGQAAFLARKHHIALALLALHSKMPKPYGSESGRYSGVFGFKTPGIELQFDKVAALTEGFERRVFFFCCRNLDDNYLSLASLGWRSDVGHYLRTVKKHLGAVLAMHELSQRNGGWTVRPLYLDSYIASEDKAAWLIEHMFEPLGLPLTTGDVVGFIERTTNRNSTLSKTGQDRRQELTLEERRTFEKAADVESLLARFNAALGTNVRILGPSGS